MIIIISLLITIPILLYVFLSVLMSPRVAVATVTLNIEAPVDWLFQIIAVDRRQTFRSDLKDVVISSKKCWSEIANDSPQVDYEEIRSIPNHLFEAHFHGYGFRGIWLVRFSKVTNNITNLYIYEEVQVKQPLLRPIIKLTYPLQAAVDRFIADLLDAIDNSKTKI
ncbi:MAG: hypothetical protein IM577_11455 [Chitinophagaceae bacterium]|jgi:hypothetical protein|nr:hypothetical protein [Chitinophagaceae bacterium]